MSDEAKLEREACIKLIQDLHLRFGEHGSDPVHKVDRTRTEHYFNEPSQDPPMLKGYEAHARQWTGLRDKNTELTSRLCANPILPDVMAPRPSATLEGQASDCEAALLVMQDEWEEEDGVSPQALVADGVGRLSAVGLHWYLNLSVFDGLEKLDYDEADELPDDEAERKRYTEDEYEEPIGKKKAKRYRETVESFEERRAIQRARCGSPWVVEVLEPTEFAYLEYPKEMRKRCGRFQYLLKFRAIDLLAWQEGRKLDRAMYGSALPADVLPGGQLDTSQPTMSPTGRNLVFYQLWSKDYIYEYVVGLPEGGGPDFRCMPNRQKMVPLALVAAKVNLSRDHVRRYEPALASWFRKKPEYDRYIANRGVLAETGAIPRYILQPKDNALPPLTDEAGHPLIFSEQAMAAYTVPEGYEFVRIGGDGAGADYVKYGEELRLELLESQPPTGNAEIDSKTQPWTGRMLLSQANEFPAMVLEHMRVCWRIMYQNIADVNGDEKHGPGDICFYPKGEDGKRSDAVVVIKPEQWRGLRYDAIVNKTSVTEQITKQEHLREQLKDPLVMMPLETYLEEGENRQNPQREVAKRLAWKYAMPVIENAVKQRVTAWAGSKFALTPDMRIVDATNRIVPPGEALQAAGLTPTPTPSPMPAGGGGNSMVTPQATMPVMPNQPAANGMAAVDGMIA